MRSHVGFSALPGALLGLLTLMEGCTSQGPAPAPGPSSGLPPAVSRALLQRTPVDPALVAADDGLGFRLMNDLRLAKPGSNLVLSPLSLGLALDMAYAGAAGETRKAMTTALQLGPVAGAGPEEANAALQASLAPTDPGARLRVANSLWTRQGVPLPSFLALNETYYGAYVGDLAAAPAAVNAWAARQTQGQIPALLPPGCDCRKFDLLLVNTLCFNGTWRVPFQPALTGTGPFTRRDGSKVDCQLMHRTGLMAYSETSEYQAVRLGYGNGRFGMILVLPAPGVGLERVAAVGPVRCGAPAQALGHAVVQIALPRFSCGSSEQLRGPLTALGMGLAFDPAKADFSAMATVPQAILAVVHQARITVDEQGTLATAGTAVQMAPTAVLADPRPMVLDRPFLVAIVDQTTSAVIFLGQVADPSAS